MIYALNSFIFFPFSPFVDRLYRFRFGDLRVHKMKNSKKKFKNFSKSCESMLLSHSVHRSTGIMLTFFELIFSFCCFFFLHFVRCCPLVIVRVKDLNRIDYSYLAKSRNKVGQREQNCLNAKTFTFYAAMSCCVCMFWVCFLFNHSVPAHTRTFSLFFHFESSVVFVFCSVSNDRASSIEPTDDNIVFKCSFFFLSVFICF